MRKSRKRRTTESPLRLIKRSAEFQPIENWSDVPRGVRGIYVLYRCDEKSTRTHMNVVYVGMAKIGIRARLENHVKYKSGLWTHFSVFEVWENIRDQEIEELEGLFRHLYRRDARANELNIQRSYKLVRKVRVNDFSKL